MKLTEEHNGKIDYFFRLSFVSKSAQDCENNEQHNKYNVKTGRQILNGDGKLSDVCYRLYLVLKLFELLTIISIFHL